MGESRCDPDPIPVRIVQDAGLAGVPGRTLGQYLLQNGIIKDLPAPIAGGFIEDFGVNFDINCVLSPLERSEVEVTATTPAGSGVDVVIRGIPNRVRVIRSLAWSIAFSGAAVPDNVSVLYDAQVALFPGVHLFDGGPFPASNLVIGDVTSALTSHMRAMLPLTLLPGDQLVFRQTRSGVNLLNSTVRIFQEEYILPFRPPGL